MKVIKSVLIIGILFTMQAFQGAEKRPSEDVGHREDILFVDALDMPFLDHITIKPLDPLDLRVSKISKEAFSSGLSQEEEGYVAYFKEDPIGYVTTMSKEDYIYIAYLAVAKQYQNKGVGTMLINFLKLKYCNPIKILYVSSCLEAVSFFVKLGFKKNNIKDVKNHRIQFSHEFKLNDD